MASLGSILGRRLADKRHLDKIVQEIPRPQEISAARDIQLLPSQGVGKSAVRTLMDNPQARNDTWNTPGHGPSQEDSQGSPVFLSRLAQELSRHFEHRCLEWIVDDRLPAPAPYH